MWLSLNLIRYLQLIPTLGMQRLQGLIIEMVEYSLRKKYNAFIYFTILWMYKFN